MQSSLLAGLIMINRTIDKKYVVESERTVRRARMPTTYVLQWFYRDLFLGDLLFSVAIS